MRAEMEEINGNIVQSTLSDSFFSKNFWQNLAKFCPNLINNDVPTNINLAPGSIHVHYDSYSDRFVYNLIIKQKVSKNEVIAKVYQSLILLRNHAVENHLTPIFVPRLGIGLDVVPWQAVKQILQNIFGQTALKVVIVFPTAII